MKIPHAKSLLLPALPFAATAALLTVIQPPFDLAPLAWVALVPLILACSPAAEPRRIFAASYITGLAYWLANLYWMVPITIVGWLVFCLYTALLWPLLALGLRYCRSRRIPLFLAAAVLLVGTENMQGLFFGGFFWRFLGHSQYRNITIIQIADIFGAGGVSLLVAMVNGLVAEIILAAAKNRAFTAANLVKTAVVTITILAAVAYGKFRLDQEKTSLREGPRVASLQSNTPQHVKRTFDSGQEIFEALMPLSNEAAKAGAELIVWPETMVQAWLSPQIRVLLPPEHLTTILHNKLAEHAKNNAYVLVGAYGGVGRLEEDGAAINLAKKYNSAFLYCPDGRQYDAQYNKIHLVPFGEVLPLKGPLNWFYDALRKIKWIPYNFDYSLDAGTEYTVFEMTTPIRSAPEPNLITPDSNTPEPNLPAAAPSSCNFAVIICYEDVVPGIARKFALDRQGRKRVDFLLNISNDGWFVRSDGRDVVRPTTELAQHAAICAFRAVENRLAVVRSVNTGISCLIDSSGRIRDGFLAGTLPPRAFDRTATPGWFADNIPLDKRVTFFSKYGRCMDFCCEAAVFLIIIIPVAKRMFAAKKQSKPSARRSHGKRTRKK